MSTQVTINDVLPKTQIIATSGQTVFDANWTANADTDVLVYLRADGAEPNDVTDKLLLVDYTVTFVGSSQAVRVTLANPASADDIVTIIRDTPADRLNLYTNTNFTPSMLNQDVGILTLVDQQAQLYNESLTPHYWSSADVVGVDSFTGTGGDMILPVLGPNQFWYKSSTNSEILAATLPAGGGQLPVTLPVITYTTTPFLTNAQNLGALTTGVLKQTVTSGSANLEVLTTTGTGSVVLNVSPSITTPAVSGGTLTNVNLTTSKITGTSTTELATAATSTRTATFPDATGTVQFEKSTPTMQVFTSGSGTYTTPAGVKYLEVELVGGGAGGESKDQVALGGNGGNTTFGTALLVGNGGSNNRAGGSGSVSAPAVGYVIAGGNGQELTAVALGANAFDFVGGNGGASFFGGAGGGVGATNTGAGGAGARTGSTTGTHQSGHGGGAGGYVHAFIGSPSATYSYAVGAGGAGGVGSTVNGFAGASGIIIVKEYYQ